MMNAQFMNGQPQGGYGPPSYPPPAGGNAMGPGPMAPNAMMPPPSQSGYGPPQPGQGPPQFGKPVPQNGSNTGPYGPPPKAQNIRGSAPGQTWGNESQPPQSLANQMNGLNIGPPRPPTSAGPRPPMPAGAMPPGPLNHGPPPSQPGMNMGPPASFGPPGASHGPPMGQGPSPVSQGPPGMVQRPSPGINQGPPRPPGIQTGPPAPMAQPGLPPSGIPGQAPGQPGAVPPPQRFGPPATSGYPAGGMPPSSGMPPRPSGPFPSQGPQQGLPGPPHGMPGQGPHPVMDGPPLPGQGPLPSMSGPPLPGQGPHTGMAGPPQGPHQSMSGPPLPGQYPGVSGPPHPGQGPHMGGPPLPGQVPHGGMSGPPLAGQGPHPGMSGPPLPGRYGPPIPTMSMNVGSDSPVPGGMGGYQSSGSVMGGGYPQPGGPAAPHKPMTGPGAYPSGPAQQQQRRLDPDHMPSPCQVMEDDKRNRGGMFQTGQRSIVPPLVTTSFIAEDQGACSPRFLRSTMYNIPCTADILKQSHIPFAVTLVPFARLHPKENPPPMVDLGSMGPVRCNRCKAYMCPYMMFIDGGRKFQCSFCGCATEVPPEYFAHLDHTGRRIDCYDRPELCLGAYEFAATADYCKDGKLPNTPAYIFMIDVSYNSVKSGLVDLLCANLKNEVLSYLPKYGFSSIKPNFMDDYIGDEESEIRVGFVTYDKELHFYNVKMMVVSDVNDVFVPLLDGFFVKVSEAEQIIDSLLLQISQVFTDSRETETVLGPVIQAGLDALQSAQRSGKLIIFHSSLPTAEAPGKLTNRDDRKLLGTDKEKTLLSASSNFYTKLAADCVAAGCSVDLYLFPNSYVDVASMAEVPRLTGGSLHKYTYFQSDLDGDLLMSDLKSNLSRPVAFDAVVRVRTSTGIRAVDFYGNFYMSNTTDVELACIDSDKAITVEIKHDDKLTEAEGAFIQAAILYTSVGGKRRLRVLNMAFNCCTQVADLFRNCELDVLINFMAKQSIRECLNSNSRQVRDTLMNACAQILACYRKNCATPSSQGQLILPECMKLLPVYVNCVIKSGILQSADINTDDRSYSMFLVNAMSISDSNVYFYPRLMPLHEVDVTSTALPTPIRCSYERLRDNGVYLLENGLVMFMWIGLAVDPDWVRDVFNVPSAAQIDIDKTKLQVIDNALSKRVRQIVSRVREERHRHMKLIVVRQRDKLEPVFVQFLVEDKGQPGGSSYVDFLCHIHKEIRNLLN